MKVLLIEPPYERFVGFRSEWYPMGLTSIATYLANNGHEVRVYHAEHGSDTTYASVVKYSQEFNRYQAAIKDDAHPVWEEIKTEIARFVPDVVGLSVATPKVPSAFKIARIAKSVYPSVKIIVGGQHPTLLPEEMIACPDIDFVIRGEGEETARELIDSFGSDDADFPSIKGISFIHNGKIVHNPERRLFGQIDVLSFPDRNCLLHLDTFTPVQLSMVMTSRGCPYKCGFCSSQNMWTRQVRFRSITNILNEIRYLKETYGVQNITFMDDSFTINKKRVTDLCTALMDERMDITWSCLTRVNVITDDMIRVMKKAGCTKVDIGIESGNQRILDLIQKDITLNEVRQVVKVLRNNDMFWSGFFMFGFPTETKQEVLDTLDLLKELRPDWANISIFTPYPGTPLFDLAQQKGMIPDKPDYTLYSHQNIESRCTDMLSPETFNQLAFKVFREVHTYNSSYRKLFKRALTRGYLKNPKLFILDVQKVISWMRQ